MCDYCDKITGFEPKMGSEPTLEKSSAQKKSLENRLGKAIQCPEWVGPDLTPNGYSPCAQTWRLKHFPEFKHGLGPLGPYPNGFKTFAKQIVYNIPDETKLSDMSLETRKKETRKPLYLERCE